MLPGAPSQCTRQPRPPDDHPTETFYATGAKTIGGERIEYYLVAVTPAEFAAFKAAEVRKYEKRAREAGLKVE